MVFKHPKSDNWYYKFHWRGELVRRSTRQTNKRLAEQLEAAHKTALAKGEVGIKEREPAPTLAVFAPRFVEAIETQCADKPATVSFYKEKLGNLLDYAPFAKAKLDSIDEAMIDEYKNRRSRQTSRRKIPLAPASVNRELATLRRLLRMAQEWKVIDRVPRIRLLGGEHRREFVLGHDLEPAYLGACAQPLRDIALLMIDSGLRMGEALSLCWQDVKIEPAGAAKFGYLTVRAGKSKNSKGRNMPLSQRVQEMLKTREPEASGLVFHREDGTPLLPTSVNHQHSAVRKDMKLPADFTPHSLRHTFGTRLGESGAEAFTIMKLMGHSSVTISQLYVHPTPDTIERAFERLQAVNEKARSGAVLLSGLPADSTEEEAA